jgi:hypothetical protein
MKYNIEKINGIAEKLAEMVEEAIVKAGRTELQIGDVEMALRESLREIGCEALRCFLENAGGEIEAEIEISTPASSDDLECVWESEV